MDRLIAANSVPMAQADTAPISGTPQGATDGNPAANIPATRWPSYQYNAIQEELIAILTVAGITPDRTNNSQIASAIKRLGQKTSILVDTGAVNAYVAANTPPLTVATWVDGTVQAVKIAHTNTGASTYAPDGLTAIPIFGLGLQPLQGGELFLGGTAVLMRATIAGVNSGNPICVLMECAGGAQQVPPATQPQHAMQLGQATGRLLNIQVFTSSGTYTPTPGTKSIIVEAIGGGGSGGGVPVAGAGNVSAGGGGSTGSYAKAYFTSNITSQAVTIGAGGVGVVGGAGGSGGTTSFGSLVICPGGSGAAVAITSSSANVTGSGGAASSNPTISGASAGYSFAGSVGDGGIALSGSSGLSGAGINTSFGAGGGQIGANGTIVITGVAATGPGASGSGALGIGNGIAAAGGNGFKGQVVIFEYA
ncbi:glycine-rich domain-containing protein [Burkholderia sp. BC1]|uniref:glycine-rich domain-containing protein n=1 Tax=Burkholderia sp. BC1 TaxID=1095370 RepID=UPI00404497F6